MVILDRSAQSIPLRPVGQPIRPAKRSYKRSRCEGARSADLRSGASLQAPHKGRVTHAGGGVEMRPVPRSVSEQDCFSQVERAGSGVALET